MRELKEKVSTWWGVFRKWVRTCVVEIRSTPLYVCLLCTLIKEFFCKKPLKILFAPNGDGATISFCSVELKEDVEECMLLSDSSIEVSGYSNGWILFKKKVINQYFLQDIKNSANFFELGSPLKKVKPHLMGDLKVCLGFLPSSMLHLFVLLRKNAAGDHVLHVCEINTETKLQQWRAFGPIERIEEGSIPTIEVPVIVHDEIVFLLKTQTKSIFKLNKIDYFSKSEIGSLNTTLLNFIYPQDHLNLLVVRNQLSIAHTQQQYGIEIRSLNFELREWRVFYVLRSRNLDLSPFWRIIRFLPRNEMLIQTQEQMLIQAGTSVRTVYLYKAEEYGIVLLELGL